MIDTHCHLDCSEFETDRDQILERCERTGINKIVIPGVTEKGWDTILSLSKSKYNLHPALGLHPCFLNNVDQSSCQNLERFLKQDASIVAVGETGLDFFIKDYDESRQMEFFENQIELAKDVGLPLILHVRKAHDQSVKLMKQKRFDQGGIVHCYSGSLQQAKQYLDLGFKLGIGGVITYERSHRLQKIVKELSLSAFVLETDAPDIPPFGRARTRNSPEYLLEIFEAFASYRSENAKIIKRQILMNTTEILPRLDLSSE
ncbi:TatD family hydrolase [bacterium]|nr:TatD family hydrolase [bacterium]